MDKYKIPSLAKACQVLNWLAANRTTHSVSEIARRVDMPRTTAFRVLRTLCSEGLIEESGGKYRGGIGLLRLGLSSLQTDAIWMRSDPVLHRLAQATGETAHLAVPAGQQMLILQVADSPHPIRVASRPGTVVSMHCSATGKAYLASLPPDRASELIDCLTLDPRTDRTITTPAGLRAELESARRQGFAVDDEEYHAGVRCLAAAVYDTRGHVAGALGITAATQRFTKRKMPSIAREVTRAAEILSRALGVETKGRVI